MTLFMQTVVNGILASGLYALVAIGFSLVFGVMRIINFAHGEFVMLGAYGAYWFFTLAGVPPHISMLLIMALVAALALFIQRVVIRPVLDAPHLNQIVLTFGLATVLQNMALLAWSAELRAVKVHYAVQSISIGPLSFGLTRVSGFLLAVVLTALLFAFLRYTETGRIMRAVAQDARTAMLMGINVHFVHYVVLALSAALAAAAGVIASVTLFVWPYLGYNMILKTSAIVILGGLGHVHGAIVAALLLGIVEAFVSTYVSGGSGWSEAVAFLVIIVTLLLRPGGIFGTEA